LELLTVFKFLSKVSDSEREMTILYAVVARGTVVLAVYVQRGDGEHGAVARRILEKLPAEADSKLCFSQDSYILHILRSDGLAFL
jgi:vesicle-associated membrane protein 7